jgi:hypothetical protein
MTCPSRPSSASKFNFKIHRLKFKGDNSILLEFSSVSGVHPSYHGTFLIFSFQPNFERTVKAVKITTEKKNLFYCPLKCIRENTK